MAIVNLYPALRQILFAPIVKDGRAVFRVTSRKSESPSWIHVNSCTSMKRLRLSQILSLLMQVYWRIIRLAFGIMESLQNVQ